MAGLGVLLKCREIYYMSFTFVPFLSESSEHCFVIGCRVAEGVLNDTATLWLRIPFFVLILNK